MKKGHRLFILLLLIIIVFAGLALAPSVKSFLAESPKVGFAVAESSTYSTRVDTANIMKRFRYEDSLWQINRTINHPALLDLLEKSKSIGFAKGIFIASSRLGKHILRKDSAALALAYFNDALPYVNYPENISKSAALYLLTGQCYANMGLYSKAIGYYSQSLNAINKSVQALQANDSFDVMNSFGIVWSRLGMREYSLRAFRKGYEIGVYTHDSEKITMSYHNIANVYMSMKQFDTAEIYFLRLLDVQMNGSQESSISLTLGNLAQLYNQKEEYTKGLAYIERALVDTFADELRPMELIQLRRIQALLYKNTHRVKEGEKVLLSALADARALQNEYAIEMELSLARLYSVSGNYSKAYEYLSDYVEKRDSLIEHEKARSLAIWAEGKAAENDKAMMGQQLFIARQQSQLQKKNLLIGGTAIGGLSLLAIIFMLVRNYRHKQIIQRARITQMEQCQEIDLLKAKVQGEEEERCRIGRDLHDNIASQLWAMRLNVENLQQDEYSQLDREEKLNLLYRQLFDAGEDVRKTAHNLMPDLLLEDGLATALASICNKTKLTSGMEVDFLEYGIMPALDRGIELSIYRMLQELIQNVLKHARHATQLLVQLSCADMMLNITVEDNGMGCKDIREGVGLLQIRRRTAALKGIFDLQSNPGKGTTAYLEFDLRRFL